MSLNLEKGTTVFFIKDGVINEEKINEIRNGSGKLSYEYIEGSRRFVQFLGKEKFRSATYGKNLFVNIESAEETLKILKKINIINKGELVYFSDINGVSEIKVREINHIIGRKVLVYPMDSRGPFEAIYGNRLFFTKEELEDFIRKLKEKYSNPTNPYCSKCSCAYCGINPRMGSFTKYCSNCYSGFIQRF